MDNGTKGKLWERMKGGQWNDGRKKGSVMQSSRTLCSTGIEDGIIDDDLKHTRDPIGMKS